MIEAQGGERGGTDSMETENGGALNSH